MSRRALVLLLALTGVSCTSARMAGRDRPIRDDPDAFPSSHATQAFAVASAIAAHYDHRPWVKWAAYGLATGVGICVMPSEVEAPPASWGSLDFARDDTTSG